MRIQCNAFASENEAHMARTEFPQCGTCGADLKLQHIRSRWHLLCIANRAHRSIASRKVPA